MKERPEEKQLLLLFKKLPTHTGKLPCARAQNWADGVEHFGDFKYDHFYLHEIDDGNHDDHHVHEGYE